MNKLIQDLGAGAFALTDLLEHQPVAGPPSLKGDINALITLLNTVYGTGPFLPLAGGTMVGNILFSPDNTRDIGASGATRPRTGYWGTSLVSPLLDSPAATALSLASAGTIRANFSTTGHLLFNTDNTNDIGATGATRPRTGYFGTSVITPLVTATTLAGTLSTAAQPNVTSLGTLGAALLFTDNSFDIGAAGATRPRTGYFGTSIVSPLFTGALTGAASLNVLKAGDTMTGKLIITQTTANTAILNSTGYSLTGADATSLIDLAGTWNTTGVPTAIKLNVTNTASNVASLLIDLQIGGVSKFSVDRLGNVISSSRVTASNEIASSADFYINSNAASAGVYFGTGGGDTALLRTSAGLLQICNGAAGTFRDLTLRALNMATAGLLSITSGANQRAGNATLVGGTITVANTTVTANTVIMLTRKTSGGTIGTAITYTVIAATSFTINSDSVIDTSTFSYLLIEVP